jgi:formate transporter
MDTAHHSPGGVPWRIDPYAPAEMAARVQTAGVHEARLDAVTTVALAVIGGAFIAIGAAFATATIAASGLGYSAGRFLGGMAFSLGLVLVVVGGGELFTSNNLIAMAWASGKVRTRQLLRNWGLVYLGNLVGVTSTALLVYVAGIARFGDGAVATGILDTAVGKVGRPFVQNVALGILGNAIVCLAVWLCFSARSTVDKVLCVGLAMIALVTLNVDHVVANMYYLTAGLLAVADPGLVAASGRSASELAQLTPLGAVGNLLPVTIGNVIGGGVLVAVVYWFVYLRGEGPAGASTDGSASAGPTAAAEPGLAPPPPADTSSGPGGSSVPPSPSTDGVGSARSGDEPRADDLVRWFGRETVVPAVDTRARVVVGVDGSRYAAQALRWAAEEARMRGARLQLVHTVPAGSGTREAVLTASEVPGRSGEGSARSVLEHATGAVDLQEGSVEQTVASGNPAERLCDAAVGADLLVVGARGQGGFRGLLLGSVSQQVVAHAPCPVVVVGPASHWSG